MKTLICFSLSSTLRPRSVVASLTLDELSAGNSVTVLDVSDFSYVRQDLPPAWFARLWGHRADHSALNNFFLKREVPFFPLQHTGPHRELPNHIRPVLDDAVNSELVTYVRSDSPDPRSRFVKSTMRRISQAAEPSYWALRNYLTKFRPDKILIPNGRVAHQRLLILAAQDERVSVEYYEIGRAMPLTYYRGPFQVHDRTGTQEYVDESTAKLSDDDCEKLAHDWLNLRMAESSPTNPYSSRWLVSPERRATKGPRQRAVFFSSSVDEFASYGAEWLRHDWESQFEAFAAILRRIDQESVECFLRIHPALSNKGRRYVRREIQSVAALQKEFPNLIVYWHTDPMSSYRLLESADMVFVGRSTLGLEGSCLGKSVWTTTAARYDECADVKNILSASDLEHAELKPWKVRKELAWRFVASWVVQDYPLTVGEETWSTFDSANPPPSMRVGMLLVPNSLLHRFHLIRLETRRRINLMHGQLMERRVNGRT